MKFTGHDDERKHIGDERNDQINQLEHLKKDKRNIKLEGLITTKENTQLKNN